VTTKRLKEKRKKKEKKRKRNEYLENEGLDGSKELNHSDFALMNLDELDEQGKDLGGLRTVGRLGILVRENQVKDIKQNQGHLS
jgi:hypothetical protein